MTYHLLRQRILRELRAFLDPVEAQQEARRWFEDGLRVDAAWLARHGTPSRQNNLDSSAVHRHKEPQQNKLNRTVYFDAAPKDRVPIRTERRVEAWLQRRLQGEPWALILGWTPFQGRPFKVAKGVLIPQLESETTVKAALEVGRALGVRQCVDVGAGVGNIGLTLALETGWDLTLTEIDPRAMRLARINGRCLGAKARYAAGDLLEPVPDPVELVVANMPFVDEAQAASLEAALDFEPALAMLASDGGIALSTALLDQARARGARACVVEIGAGQGRELKARTRSQGWPWVSVLQDARGQDRVIVARAVG